MDLILELVFWIIGAVIKGSARPSQPSEEGARSMDRLSWATKTGGPAAAAEHSEFERQARRKAESDKASHSEVSEPEAKSVDVWEKHLRRQAEIDADYQAKAARL